MNRPTIALAMIVKDEAHNLPKLLKSIEGCFDEIHITDTGSTDNTIEIAKDAGCIIHHFDWIDDFAAARNYSFSHPQTDYIMWMDGDDVLGNKEEFLKWRDNVMLLADYWFVNYNYAYNDTGKPVCIFARERVVKRTSKFTWKFFIHEGMIPDSKVPIKAQAVKSWSVNHMRTVHDLARDRGRNITIIEKHLANNEVLPDRLQFYYGKELFDVGRVEDAFKVLNDLHMDNMEPHDRILAIQYLTKSLLLLASKEEGEKKNNLLNRSFQTAVTSTILDPKRAEFYILAGDALISLNRFADALPYYNAAKGCLQPPDDQVRPLFQINEFYGFVPMEQIARIYIRLEMPEKALSEAKSCYDLFGKESTKQIISEIERLIDIMSGNYSKDLEENGELIISCMPGSCPYPWDDEIYKQKGIGGSETAAVEVAEKLAVKTGRKVRVFNDRDETRVSDNGVEYTPNSEMREYLLKYKPYRHIAWRHNQKLTEAPTYLWCHDLVTPGGESHKVYDKILCLSDFHKNFVQIMQGIPDKKIQVTRNGLDMDRFENFSAYKKNPLKIIFPSSPDRGLDRTIEIVKKARGKSGLDLQLHVFYGFENLRKYGQGELADKLEGLLKKHHWIKYHGNVEQRVLAQHMMESSVWLYPADFIETFCITAIEALASRCFPLAREIGALKDTLGPAHKKGMAELVFSDAVTYEEVDLWANKLISAVKEEKWRDIIPEMFNFSWDGVVDEFIDFMDIKPMEYKTVSSKTEEVVERTTI